VTDTQSNRAGGPPPSPPKDFSVLASDARARFDADAASIQTRPRPDNVEGLRIRWLGRKGHLQELMEELRHVSKEARPEAGKAVNTLRAHVEGSIASLKTAAAEFALNERLNAEPVDVTLPALGARGSLHPVTLMRRIILREFRKLGFTVADGPEADFDFYNFNALNIPEHHPAREMQDTFYVANVPNLVLRTQTSNIQIHAMLGTRPPLRIVAPGRVFRCDSDVTHTPMFHQIEGFVVDRGISFAHLKATLDTFLRAVYGEKLKTRFRPSFFPFVEPGAECDIECSLCGGAGCRVCKHTGWIEIGGCGMIHPNVFESVGYDSEEWTGFAFGFGLDRMAMSRWSLPDLRQLFEGDHDFLGQFGVFV